MPQYEVVEVVGVSSLAGQFASDVLSGLGKEPKAIAPCWFYDSEGSRLFERITTLPEYYPTRCEREIFERYPLEIAQAMPNDFRLVELGAGDGHKTKILLRSWIGAGKNVQFAPIDICEQSVAELTASIAREMPYLSIMGRVQDYFEALTWLKDHDHQPTLALFLGGNVGNFDVRGDEHFLHRLYASLRPGDAALIGFDLIKDPEILIPAYDDSEGVTREFNLNLLRRINRELEADFNPDRFQHQVIFNRRLSRMESYLVSTCYQEVHILGVGATFAFQQGERIHTECSNKYTRRMIADLAEKTGFVIEKTFLDSQGYFADVVFRR